MHTRRTIIRTLPAVVTGILAGCGSLSENSGSGEDDIQDSDGDGVIDSEDYAPRDPDVQERADVQSGETATTVSDTSTETQTQSPTAPPSETPTTAQTPTPTATPTPSDQEEQTAFENYRAGYRDANNAAEKTELAANEYNNENYSEAERHYQEALETNREGKENFERAVELIDESEHPEAYDAAQSGVEFSEVAIEARNTAIDACQAAIDENYEEAQNLMNEVSEHHDTLDEINNGALDLDEMREALDI